MKTWTKWLLGILIGVLVIAAIGVIGYLAVRSWNGPGWTLEARMPRYWEGSRVMPWHMLPQRPGRIAPVLPFGGFYALRLLGSGLLCLGLLALIGLGILALVRTMQRPLPAAVAPAQPIPPAPAPVLACANCGRTIQEDWSHCPYCGTALHPEPGQTPPA